MKKMSSELMGIFRVTYLHTHTLIQHPRCFLCFFSLKLEQRTIISHCWSMFKETILEEKVVKSALLDEWKKMSSELKGIFPVTLACTLTLIQGGFLCFFFWSSSNEQSLVTVEVCLKFTSPYLHAHPCGLIQDTSILLTQIRQLCKEVFSLCLV